MFHRSDSPHWRLKAPPSVPRPIRMPCACQIPVPQYPDTADWGPILWTILHGLAEKAQRAGMPADEVREWQKFVKLTGEMLPCDRCRAHYQAYSKTHPLTQFADVPYSQLKTTIKTWFWTLHNEVNIENGKPVFAYEDLETTYANVNFQDQFWRLEPIIKKAINIQGMGLLTYMNWVKSFKMLRAILYV